MNRLYTGDCRTILPQLVDRGVRVQTCITSPPYYGLRDYGMPGQIGLEETLAAYIETLVSVFRQVRELLNKDGTLWLNLGDCYSHSGKGRNGDGSPFAGHADEEERHYLQQHVAGIRLWQAARLTDRVCTHYLRWMRDDTGLIHADGQCRSLADMMLALRDIEPNAFFPCDDNITEDPERLASHAAGIVRHIMTIVA